MNKDLKKIYDKIHTIKNILMDEFSELSKEKAELIANRIYDLDGKYDTQISDDTSNQHHMITSY